MSGHSLINCWVHIVWSTKERFPYFANPEMANECSKILLEISRENNFRIKTFYVNPEHVHILLKLNQSCSLEEIVKKLKGVSSHTINKSWFSGKFKWERGYSAFSVSPNVVDKVINYIEHQKEHHRVKTFVEEWEIFLKEYEKEYGTH